MKIEEAADLLGITGDITPDIVKKAFRRAAMTYHPDRNPAGAEVMKAINAAYEILKNYDGNIAGENTNYAEHLSEALNKIIHLTDIQIEICGNWIWVSGNTYQHRAIFNEAGFFWASVKKMWYFRPEDWKSSNRQNCDIDVIRQKHGTVKVKTQTAQQLK